MKNKSYIGISLIILVFGILIVPKIVDRVKSGDITESDRLNVQTTQVKSDLVKIGPAPSFSLTDQHKNTITNESYAGKVYVLEFFFSTCPTICPKMNANLKEVQQQFKGLRDFGIASITINPEHDTAEVLKQHAADLEINDENWHFLTGDKDYIYKVANKGFNMYAAQNSKVNGGFEHSGLFALIDKEGNIRCRKDDFGNPILYYDGLEKSGIKALTEDIKLLLKE
ncbi:SCO family protein [Flavobacterium tegetincola]|uniref:SCO family protein n=1 Tax=Flavobacterium tegetincola TaxID=150172 RepID=UPI00040D2CA1|nr:SCO family protein [Flavobacterium tegetincola]